MGNLPLMNKLNYISEFNWIPSYRINNIIIKKNYFNQDKLVEHYINDSILVNKEINSKPYEQVIDTIFLSLEITFNNSIINKFKPSYKFLKDILEKTIGNKHRLSFLDFIQIIQHFGLIDEDLYRKNNYIINNELLNNSFKYKYINFIGIKDIHLIKNKICDKKVILFGMPVSDSFLNTSKDPLLKIDNKIIIGGVSGLLIGFDEKKKIFILKLTKGKKWGNNGNIYIPYEYILEFNPEMYYIEINVDLILSKNIEKLSNLPNNQNNKLSEKWSLIGI